MLRCLGFDKHLLLSTFNFQRSTFNWQLSTLGFKAALKVVARREHLDIGTMATNQQNKKARHIYICFSITIMIEVFELSTNRYYCTVIAGDHHLLIFKFWKMRNHRCEFSDSDAVIFQHSNHRGETPQTKRNNKMKIRKWNSTNLD